MYGSGLVTYHGRVIGRRARAAATRSRCCRHRTPAATGSRSSSGVPVRVGARPGASCAANPLLRRAFGQRDGGARQTTSGSAAGTVRPRSAYKAGADIGETRIPAVEARIRQIIAAEPVIDGGSWRSARQQPPPLDRWWPGADLASRWRSAPSCMVLDSTIANVSLPTIAGNLGASKFGQFDLGHHGIRGVERNRRAVDRIPDGPVRRGAHLLHVAVLLFTAASFLCGIAWSLSSLIFFRVLQGAVSGPMMPGSQALLISIFAGRTGDRPRSASGR